MKIIISPASTNMIDSSFNHVLDNFAVTHIFNKHANEKEVQRGQIMVEISDFLLIPDILANYDSCTILSHPTGRKLIIIPNNTKTASDSMLKKKEKDDENLRA